MYVDQCCACVQVFDRYTFLHYFYRQFNIAASCIYSLTHSLITHSLIAQHLFLPMSSSLNSHSSSMTDDTLIIHSGTPLSVGDDQVRATHSLTPLLHHSLTPSPPHPLTPPPYSLTHSLTTGIVRRDARHTRVFVVLVHSLTPSPPLLHHSVAPSLPYSLTAGVVRRGAGHSRVFVVLVPLGREAAGRVAGQAGLRLQALRYSLTHSLTH
jgi:hypothetical protein